MEWFGEILGSVVRQLSGKWAGSEYKGFLSSESLG